MWLGSQHGNPIAELIPGAERHACGYPRRTAGFRQGAARRRGGKRLLPAYGARHPLVAQRDGGVAQPPRLSDAEDNRWQQRALEKPPARLISADNAASGGAPPPYVAATDSAAQYPAPPPAPAWPLPDNRPQPTPLRRPRQAATARAAFRPVPPLLPPCIAATERAVPYPAPPPAPACPVEKDIRCTPDAPAST